MHRGMHRDIQWLTVDDRGVQGVTGTYSGTQGMRTVADRGVQGLCTGDDMGCTGDDRENTGVDRERQGIFIRTGLFKASSVSF